MIETPSLELVRVEAGSLTKGWYGGGNSQGLPG